MAQRLYGDPYMMPDGSIEYLTEGAKLPPNINGFDRDPDNPRRFISQFDEPCQSRLLLPNVGPCGKVFMHIVCSAECPHKNKSVSPDDCFGCPFLKPPVKPPPELAEILAQNCDTCPPDEPVAL